MPPEWLQLEQVPVETDRVPKCCTAVQSITVACVALMNQVDKIRQVVFTPKLVSCVEAMQRAFRKPYESQSGRPGVTSRLPGPLVDDTEGVGLATRAVRSGAACHDMRTCSFRVWHTCQQAVGSATGPQHTAASC